MMGKRFDTQTKFFYPKIDIEKRIPDDHILRKIRKYINFDFIYKEVGDKYGKKGNVSIPPPVILKLMLLLILYDVSSERELMRSLKYRLDWLWFLGYDIDENIPDHSVLSKARKRWGLEAFKKFFENILWQCVERGLIEGDKLFIDSSIVQANASNNSVIKTDLLRKTISKSFKKLESRLDVTQDENAYKQDKVKLVNDRYVSTTDSDARVVRRGGGKAKLSYQVHRGVDPLNEIITATQVTPGNVNEGRYLKSILEDHKRNTETNPNIIIGDSKYGIIENYLFCYDNNIQAHMPPYESKRINGKNKKNIYPKEKFNYCSKNDIYICPAGKKLYRNIYYRTEQRVMYRASADDCNHCRYRKDCTNSKNGRTLKRHIRQDEIDIMYGKAKSYQAKQDQKIRQHLSERSFAHSTRYGYKRARWRGLWKEYIQEYLTSTIQNIKILIKNIERPPPSIATYLTKINNKNKLSIKLKVKIYFIFRYIFNPNDSILMHENN